MKSHGAILNCETRMKMFYFNCTDIYTLFVQLQFYVSSKLKQKLCVCLKTETFFSSQVYAEGLIYLESGRTLQGSSLSFSCGGPNNIVSAAERKEEEMKTTSKSVFYLFREKFS